MPFFNAKNNEVPDHVKTQVCIIGAGAAGITLARKLKGAKDVILVDSGDFGLDGATQSLYSAKNIGLKYLDLLKCRLRYFGGTTNHWNGYCRANDPVDYEGRPSLNLPRWPVQHEDLKKYIDEASSELGLKYDFFDNSELLKDKDIPESDLLDTYSPDLQTKVFQLTQHMRFSSIYRETLDKQANLKVFLNLNAVHLQLNELGTSLQSATFKTLDNKQVIIEAQEFIVACHGIENARLLLNSNDVHKNGIGNNSDHVGRYFMDHIHLKASKLIPSENFPRLYDYQVLRKQQINANISFSDDFTRKNDMLQYYCRFMSVYASLDELIPLWNVKEKINEPYSAELFHDVKSVISSFSNIADYLSHQQGINTPVPQYYVLDQRLEQAPNRNSRVLISDRKDSLGVPIADLHWDLTEHDYRSFRLGQEKIVKEMSAIGAGRFVIEEITPELVKERVKGHYHHIGTTRMSTSSSNGVVDVNAKVHEVNNLYIAGSSIFPTAGYSGPTMMIVALSMKLADHLSSKLGHGVS